MTRLGKLYAKLLERRPLSFAEFESLLRAFGFELDRTRGSHRNYRRPGIAARINVQPDGRDAKPYQVRQFVDIIETYGLTLDEDA